MDMSARFNRHKRMKAESKQIPQKLKLATTTTLKFVWHLSLFGISFFACLLTFYVWATLLTSHLDACHCIHCLFDVYVTF